jgi:hypothetical protein
LREADGETALDGRDGWGGGVGGAREGGDSDDSREEDGVDGPFGEGSRFGYGGALDLRRRGCGGRRELRRRGGKDRGVALGFGFAVVRSCPGGFGW